MTSELDSVAADDEKAGTATATTGFCPNEKHELICSGCGVGLKCSDSSWSYDPDEYCVLECECSEYPVVAGIPLVFSDRVAEREVTTARLVYLIRAGRFEQALLEALTPKELGDEQPRGKDDKAKVLEKLTPSALGKRKEARRRDKTRRLWQKELIRLSGRREQGSTIDLLQHYFSVHTAGQAAGDYFSYRFGQPKYLVTLSLARAMSAGKGAILDLGCGAGHLTRNLLLQRDNESVYGVDQDFFLLWIATTRIAPRGRYVCADLEYGLPFASKTFSSILMSNFFQFLYGKRQLVVESERALVDEQSVIILSSLRHSGFAPPTANQAISVSSYLGLFSIPSVAIDDDVVLEGYVAGKGPDLAEQAAMSLLSKSPLVSIVASGNALTFRDYGEFAVQPHQLGSPRVNPLYREIACSQTGVSGIQYKISWPSEQFLEDNERMAELFPPELGHAQTEALQENENFGIFVDYPSDY